MSRSNLPVRRAQASQPGRGGRGGHGDEETNAVPVVIPSSPQSDDPNSSASSFSHATLDLQPFLDTTFSLHRVSPLHVGATGLSRLRLDLLAKRLRDTLVGDVVRGVRVGLEGSDLTLGATGALQGVDLHWVDMESFLGKEGGGERRRRRGSATDLRADLGAEGDVLLEGEKKRRALWLDIGYENVDCTAILLPRMSVTKRRPPETSPDVWARSTRDTITTTITPAADHSSFMHLPLLLLNMPAALKPTITAFLSSSFDCHISNLRLGTRTLVQSWESWIRENPPPASAKDVVITLGFRLPAHPVAAAATGIWGEGKDEESSLGLKGIDIIIPAQDVARLYNAGKSIPTAVVDRDEQIPRKRRRGGLTAADREEGWHWRQAPEPVQRSPPHDGASTAPDPAWSPRHPFTEALARYVDKHLALDLFNPVVRICRISCSAFMLAEGRMKVFGRPRKRGEDVAGDSAGEVPHRVWEFMDGLVNRAAEGLGG